jgi:hypothetical protein
VLKDHLVRGHALVRGAGPPLDLLPIEEALGVVGGGGAPVHLVLPAIRPIAAATADPGPYPARLSATRVQRLAPREVEVVRALLIAAVVSAPADGGRPAVGGTPTAPAAATYAVSHAPSALLERRGELMALARQLERNLRRELAGPVDATTALGGQTALFQIAVLRHDPGAAHRAAAAVRSLIDVPARRAMAGLLTEPYVEARAAPGADFHATYRARLEARLAAVPYPEVEFTLDAVRGMVATASRAQATGTAAAALDPQVKDGRIDRATAMQLVALAANDEAFAAVKDDAVAGLDRFIAAHRADATPFAPTVGWPAAPVRGAWLGQAPPGGEPVRFAADVLSAFNAWTDGVAFSPDGTELVVSVGGATYGRSRLFRAISIGGLWPAPSPLPELSGFVSSGEAHYSEDGRSLYFTGKRPGEDLRTWVMTRAGESWSEPRPMPASINGEGRIYRGNSTHDGVWYFGRNLTGMNQIYRARATAGAQAAELLGAPINVGAFDGDPCVAPDGRWLVFHSARPGGHGGTDLYVAFADGQGGWRTPVNLGPGFNSGDDEWGSTLGADGRLLFFTRHTAKGDEIRWVSVAAIDALAGT